MRQFLIDDLSTFERDNIDSYLKRTIQSGPIEGIYWLRLPDDLLGPGQLSHDGCKPFHFSIEVMENAVSFEFLVRNQTNLHCSCIGYATPGQLDFFLRFINRLLEEEKISA